MSVKGTSINRENVARARCERKRGERAQIGGAARATKDIVILPYPSPRSTRYRIEHQSQTCSNPNVLQYIGKL